MKKFILWLITILPFIGLISYGLNYIGLKAFHDPAALIGLGPIFFVLGIVLLAVYIVSRNKWLVIIGTTYLITGLIQSFFYLMWLGSIGV